MRDCPWQAMGYGQGLVHPSRPQSEFAFASRAPASSLADWSNIGRGGGKRGQSSKGQFHAGRVYALAR